MSKSPSLKWYNENKSNPEVRAKRRSRSLKWYYENRDRPEIRQRALLNKKDYAQRVLYGITLEAKKAMYEAQSGLCGLCGESLPADFNKACTDHDHKNKRVRELLHRYCNVILGYEENHSGFLEKVLAYKKRWER